MTEAVQDNPDQWAKLAMDLLRADNLSPTPNNFAVFYAYASGKNPNLNMSVDTLLMKNGHVTQGMCTELFLTFISLDAENKALQTISSSIEDEIRNVMGVLSKSQSEAQKFDQTLSSFSGELKDTASLDQIKAAVSRVADETRMMAEQNQRLHAQLSQSTQELTEMRFNLDEVRKASLIDPLTEIGNRKYFDNEIVRVMQEAKEAGTPLCMLMADIDHFKKFNDTYGHLIGDEVLKLVARTLVENLKGRDIIARYGGEEFVILLPQTALQDAERVGNMLRSILSTKQVTRRRTNETLGVITISIGATQFKTDDEIESFIARADAALYDAKQSGRNKVCLRAEA